jgi:hypothetical protein
MTENGKQMRLVELQMEYGKQIRQSNGKQFCNSEQPPLMFSMPNCMQHQMMMQEIVCIEQVPEETNRYWYWNSWNFEETFQTLHRSFGNFKRNGPKDLKENRKSVSRESMRRQLAQCVQNKV